ncbi:(2Fe-2S)-binding protein [Hymenobacter nivis]|uniref:(2Fe-2S)-binding protein n=1 Tax=Hymenobacter nivis TaxID=1850093 RepID=A0A502HEU1_9BACT|nr:(2Fe-2S)-binding protein [Hymenobacter nivis]TPG71728.1 (2Fe-2S)-binding protein [Hymenobacter nivis]
MSLHFTQEALDKTPPTIVPTQPVTLNVNGEDHTIQIAPWTSLLDALREYMDLTGTKKGCDHGQCGACTVLVDGKRINSCLALATVYQGKQIQTIEGLGSEDNLSPLQQAFVDHDAFQCGYCTPGQICSAQGLINEGRCKTEDEVREHLSGNLCRCGAYTNILSAVMEVLHDGQVVVDNGTLVTIPAQPSASSSVN